jgi:hypothetical protein
MIQRHETHEDRTMDRMTLRALRSGPDDRRRQLMELHAIHRPVLMGLVALFLSGVMMATADLKTFLPSPVFWLKLSLVTLLLINGAVLMRTEASLRPGADAGAPQTKLWARLRATSWLSLALWAATLIAGITLSNIS